MNEYYLMGKEAALEQLAELYDNNGGMEIGEALGHISDALFPDQDKIASIETYDDAMFTSGHEALLLEFAKEASDILADDEYEYEDVFLSALEKVAARRSDKEGYHRGRLDAATQKAMSSADAKRGGAFQGVKGLGSGKNMTKKRDLSGLKATDSEKKMKSMQNRMGQLSGLAKKNPGKAALIAGGALGAATAAGYGAKKLYDSHKEKEEQTKAAAQTFLEMGLIDEEQFGNLIEAGYFE